MAKNELKTQDVQDTVWAYSYKARMELWDYWRMPPEEALKIISGGRLNGFTDINPVWRISTATKMFGPAGIGWWLEDINLTSQEVGNQVLAFVTLNLRYRYKDETDGEIKISQPVFGVGGSTLLRQEKSGLRPDDEAYKMAFTDAMSVAMRSLGIGADIYWQKGRNTKYDAPPEPPKELTVAQQRAQAMGKLIDELKIDAKKMKEASNALVEKGSISSKSSKDMTEEEFQTTMNAIREYFADGQNA